MISFRPVLPVRVSVIVPCRNERQHIEAFLESLLRQRLDGIELEVIVADGMSEDGTRSVLAAYSARYPWIRVIDNPERIVSSGLNRALRVARGEVVIRMDVHNTYAEDYVFQCVKTLFETNADNVGGPWVALGDGYLSSAIALAFQSPFATGGGKAHSPNYEGPVDTVCFGSWRREVFERFGLFDEELVRNQDDEYNLRIRKQGGTVWQSPRIRSWYRPRSSLRYLFRQYAQYGYWRVRVIQKHRVVVSARHIVPGIFVTGLLLMGAGSLLVPYLRGALIATVALYCLVSIAASAITCRAAGQWRYFPVLPLVFLTFHVGYGWGLECGFLDFVLLRRRGRRGFSGLSRPVVSGRTR